MGNNDSRPPLGDLHIYICGNVRRYSGIISSIFTIKTRSLNNTINLKNINEDYYIEGHYNYEYLKLLNETKNLKGENVVITYNAFLFSNNVNQRFADILFFYLKDYDVNNKRKKVTIPIIIIIDRNENQNYDRMTLNGLKEKKNEKSIMFI